VIQTAEALVVVLTLGGPAAMLFVLLVLVFAIAAHPGANLKVGIV
jgi:hypothetical protein